MTQQDDITQRLRDNANLDEAEHGNARVVRLERDAADEIERLRAELSKLRAPVADERAPFEAWATAIAEKYDVTRNGDHYMEPYTEWVWEAWQASRAALASAPVAGEAPSDAEVLKVYAETVAEYADGRGFEAGTVAFARSLLRRYAAPQASEPPGEVVVTYDGDRIVAVTRQDDEGRILSVIAEAPQASAENVHNAALEEAATVAKRISDKYAFGLSSIESATADEIEREILALKQPQADKDGGQQRAGDDLIRALGECRDAFPTPDIAGSRLDLLWQEAMSDPTAVPAYVKACAARAALSAPQAEQGERDE